MIRIESAIVTPLLKWYERHARVLPWRENPEPYAVWISEIMLQQTRVEAVKPYYDRWMKVFPDLASLAAASEAEVLKLWEGLGYYSRARNLHRTAILVAEKYDGILPSSFEELRSLPGIGEYTAGAIGSIAFHLPVPCVDGNVIRVFARLTADPTDAGTAAAKKRLTEQIKEIIPKGRPGDFNQALMELGATVCLPNGMPVCEACPLASVCEARLQNRIEEFPVKSGKPARRIEKKTILVLLNAAEISCGEAPEKQFRTALRKRPDKGLLAGLWEFPNFDGELAENEIRKILDDLGIRISSLVRLKKARHIFTHLEWDMTGYLAVTEERAFAVHEASGELNFQWIRIATLDEQLSLPAAFKTHCQVMKQFISKEFCS